MAAPRWVLGRAMASYQTVAFGSMALGSWGWGLAAHAFDLRSALFAAAVVSIAGLILSRAAPLPNVARLDLSPSRAWQDPKLALEMDLATGPVVVGVEYRVPERDWAAFVASMTELRRIRRRDGARRWTLLQDLTDPETWVERFQSPSWIEHLRQHGRSTVEDRAIEMKAASFHRGPEPPRVRHLVHRRSEDFTQPRREGGPRILAPTGSMLPPLPNAANGSSYAAMIAKSE
jgi:hypothetical protein